MNRRKRRNQASKIKRRQLENRRQRNGILFNALVGWLIPLGGLFAKNRVHGNVKWIPAELAIQALIWALQDARFVTDEFTAASEVCETLKLKAVARTYTAFMNALGRYEEMFRLRWNAQFQALAREVAGRFWRNAGWVLMGFDGSRVTVPRTVSNENEFCARNYGQGKTAKYRKKKSKGMRRKKNEKSPPQPQSPQVWITMMWHMCLRLPWTWRLGPSDSSERAHVAEILKQETFPKKTLFCGDAGFVGYDFWSTILATGHFLVRVGGNVSLLSEHADILERGRGIVLCWPKHKMNRGKPLHLRLVRVKIGKTKMWMLTSVLDATELTISMIIKFYKLRWGIEVEYRGLKQTIDKRHLRCRNSDRVYVELNWSIRAMAFAELIALREQIPANNPTRKQKKRETHAQYDTKDRSLAK